MTSAFAQAHACLCSYPFSKPAVQPGSHIPTQQPVANSGMCTALCKALETIRNEIFEHFLDHLISTCQRSLREVSDKDALQSLPLLDMSAADQQQSAVTDGPSTAAWGECSNLPMRWELNLQAVLTPLDTLLGFSPSLISNVTDRLLSLLTSSCQELVQCSRCGASRLFQCHFVQKGTHDSCSA